MASIFEFFARVLGYVLNWLYLLTNNYGFAILLLTILIALVMIPVDIKNRKINKQSAKLSKIQKEIEEKYKGNREKINSEMMKEMQKQGINPLASCSGCLISLLQLFIMISIFYLVGSPLTYVKKLPKEEINKYYIEAVEKTYSEKYGESIDLNKLKEEQSNNNEQKDPKNEEKPEEQEKGKDQKDEISNEEKLKRVKEIESKFGANGREMFIIRKLDNEKVNMNLDFLGIDLSKTPRDTVSNMKDAFSKNGIKVLIIPIGYIILSFINVGIMQKRLEEQTKEAKEEVNTDNTMKSKYKSDLSEDSEKLNQEDMQDIMMSSNKTMRYIMPVMIFSITMITPIAIALYWLLSTAFDMIKNKVVDDVIEKENIEEKV